MATKGTPVNGVLHVYSKKLKAFEYTPNPTDSESQNLILFVGGLFNVLFDVSYVRSIAKSLPLSWTIGQVELSSSGIGWGTSSLAQDATELASCISYFRNFKSGKIVLMGHSTGCQDVMEYLTGPNHENRPSINGGIIQAAVSDREAIELSMDSEVLINSNEAAQKMVDAGDGDEVLSAKIMGHFFSPAPVTAKRWLSLASPNHDGADDYFSSDLSDEQLAKTFGKLPKGTSMCVLLGERDEYVPKSTDQALVLARWVEIAKTGEGQIDEVNSGVVEGASHDLDDSAVEAVESLVKRVLGFINGLSS